MLIYIIFMMNITEILLHGKTRGLPNHQILVLITKQLSLYLHWYFYFIFYLMSLLMSYRSLRLEGLFAITLTHFLNSNECFEKDNQKRTKL